MAQLIGCFDLGKTFGAQPLFSGLSLSVADKERLGIVGPNGAGKSTLLKILAGRERADMGEVFTRKGAKIAYVAQDPTFVGDPSIDEVLAQAEAGLSSPASPARAVFGKAGFTDGSIRVSALSGGYRKRLAIACELVREPDLLMLDEPTNHLDLEGIYWLEDLLASAPFAVVAVSHDRYFLEAIARRIVEISPLFPGGAFTAEGSYGAFLAKKAEFLNAQAQQQETLANKLRRETEWLQRGAQARSTKAKSRIDEAARIKEELALVRSRKSAAPAGIDFTASGRQTKKLIAVEGLAKTLGGKRLFENLKFTLSPGVRLGVLGRNGTGKSTLLRLLAGQMEPDEGRVERAAELKVVYFDQNRTALEPSLSLRRALAPESDSVVFRGRAIHVASWARTFLFRSEQLDVPVGRLSGGEQARLLIAQLMLKPADVLLLDEPTNDLDISTLEVLEESLMEFPGAVVMVTHDRYLLDRVSTTLVGLHEGAGARVYADCAQWELVQRETARPMTSGAAEKPGDKRSEKSPKAPRSGKRLSYLEQREWDQMEGTIAAAEATLATCQAQAEDPAIVCDAVRLAAACQALEEAKAKVDALYARWAELEAKLT